MIGLLSKDVFERRTATGNETFSLFTRLGDTTFVILSVFSLMETMYLKIRAHPLPKNEKRPLPVAVRRSKAPYYNLVAGSCLFKSQFETTFFDKNGEFTRRDLFPR